MSVHLGNGGICIALAFGIFFNLSIFTRRLRAMPSRSALLNRIHNVSNVLPSLADHKLSARIKPMRCYSARKNLLRMRCGTLCMNGCDVFSILQTCL
jgi:hypothetical protein